MMQRMRLIVIVLFLSTSPSVAQFESSSDGSDEAFKPSSDDFRGAPRLRRRIMRTWIAIGWGV